MYLYNPLGCLGGIGATCATNDNCVTGLSCVNDRCVCAAPAPPVITGIVMNNGLTTIAWTPSPGASTYNIFIYGPSPQTFFFYSGTSLEVALIDGLYSVTIYASSTQCGEGDPTTAQFTVGPCVQDANCPADMFCIFRTANVWYVCRMKSCPSGTHCFNGTCCCFQDF